MTKPLLIRGARQLLTLRGPAGPRRGTALRDLGIVQDGAILIRDGVILEAGSARRIENLASARNAVEIDATGRVVMPGFVDSHTHLVFGPPRLLNFEMRIAGMDHQQIADAGGGIPASLPAIRETTGRTLERRTRHLLNLFARHGTTTVEAKTGYGLDKTGELKSLRVLAALNGNPLDIVPTYFGAHGVPPKFDGRPAEYIEWICAEMLPQIARRRLARFVDVSCERSAFGLDEARRYLETALALGFSLKVQAEQFAHTGAARLAVDLEATSADHLVQTEADDIAVLAQSTTLATLLPGSVFHQGLDRYPPARALIDQGAAVALASGFNPGTSPTCSMPMILALACTQMRMTPAEAVCAATINGAHAAGCAGRAGSLEIGKQADLILLDASDYREIPYHFGMNLVAMTMKKGVILYRQGEVVCPKN